MTSLSLAQSYIFKAAKRMKVLDALVLKNVQKLIR